MTSVVLDLLRDPLGFAGECNALSAYYFHWVSKNSSLVRYELTHFFEISVVGLLANPKAFRKGLAWGVIELCSMVSVHVLLDRAIGPSQKLGKKISRGTLYPTVEYAGFRIHDFVRARTGAFLAPIIEELFYRVLIQRTLAWGLDKMFQNSNRLFTDQKIEFWEFKIGREGISIFGYQLTAKKIAILITAILFVRGHSHLDTRSQLIMFPGAVVYGFMADSDGVIAPLAAHIFNNTCANLIGSFEPS